MDRISVQDFSPGLTDDRHIGADELRQRVRQCGRLLAAWPNARPASVDATLLEYVNATRGVRIDKLPRVIDAAISAGGEFLPPAGEILGRAVRYVVASKKRAYNAHVSAEQATREEEQRQLAGLRRTHRVTAPVHLDEVSRAVGAGASVRLIGGGAA